MSVHNLLNLCPRQKAQQPDVHTTTGDNVSMEDQGLLYNTAHIYPVYMGVCICDVCRLHAQMHVYACVHCVFVATPHRCTNTITIC